MRAIVTSVGRLIGTQTGNVTVRRKKSKQGGNKTASLSSELVVPQSITLTDINTPFRHVSFSAKDHSKGNGF